MKNKTLIFGYALATGLALWAGCGGKVVIDQDELGQGGATTTTTTTGTNTTGTTTGTAGTAGTTGSSGQTGVTTTGSGGNDVKSTCQIVCDAIEKGGCPQKNCFEECVTTYAQAGDCADEFAAMLFCYGDHLDALANCGVPIACDELEESFNSCGNAGECGPQTCTGDDSGNCSCSVACGQSKFTADCSISPGGQLCTCSIDGMPVAKCDGSNKCDVFDGCCGKHLFGQGG